MGEARRRLMLGQMPAQNGHARRAIQPKSVRVVRGIRLQNNDQDGVTMLMLGETEPELCAALAPAELRKLAAGMLAHAEALEWVKTKAQRPPDPPRPMLFGPGGYPISEAERSADPAQGDTDDRP